MAMIIYKEVENPTIESWVAKMQYKDFKFCIYRDWNRMDYILNITRKVFNSLPPHEQVEVSSAMLIGRELDMPEDVFMKRVFEQILKMEEHEACEQFNYGNKKPFWPHAKEGK